MSSQCRLVPDGDIATVSLCRSGWWRVRAVSISIQSSYALVLLLLPALDYPTLSAVHTLVHEQHLSSQTHPLYHSTCRLYASFSRVPSAQNLSPTPGDFGVGDAHLLRGDLVFNPQDFAVGARVDGRQIEDLGLLMAGVYNPCPLYRSTGDGLANHPTIAQVQAWRAVNTDVPHHIDSNGHVTHYSVWASWVTDARGLVGCTSTGVPCIQLRTFNIDNRSRVLHPASLRRGNTQFIGLTIVDWRMVGFDVDYSRLRRGQGRHLLPAVWDRIAEELQNVDLL
ncbi:hypothetical protein K491DRAFT_699613 [Lophiostoma macrostomum CBS 122681]|uniref:Uncharacterized protein n=1 Tax=Lophiostoma macrostomum CBS 122681 TaxID=1314788 RepID=A0A6A6SI51_9PLEO|nr:hypothetical protein K491DRAFT_699613 [Lophiostoma macrostomum CBS 122681]